MWDNLKASIASVVRTNNNQEITGANLQSVLNTIVNSVGANATFAGIAAPSTNPGTPDGPVFYIACEPGIYSNFNLTLVNGLYVLENKTGSWVGTQINTGAAFEALIGYYNAVLNGASITVPEATTYRLTKGGVIRLKMPSAGTTASTLSIGNASNVQLWYNGAAVSTENTWEADEIISVFYDGTRFMASNSQGSGGVKIDNGNNTDLDIADEQKNVIARFKNGHVKTKNFNSENAIISRDLNNTIADLAIEDENGNILCLFRNGHILTKKFDSGNITENPFFHKKITAIGASITAGAIIIGGASSSVKSYTQVVAEKYGMYWQNIAVGGYTMKQVYGLVPSIALDSDIIMFAMDAANNSMKLTTQEGQLGNFWNVSGTTRTLNTSDETICSYINRTILAIRAIFPTKFLLMTTTTNQTLGYFEERYAGCYNEKIDELVYTASRIHNVPVFDIGRETLINSRNQDLQEIYYTGTLRNNTPDYSHPNALGHERIGLSLCGWLERYKYLI